jgi:hypothetical protein
MRKVFLGSAMVVLILLTAGFASAFETTENDGFIYLIAPGQTTATETTLYDGNTANLAPSSFQVTVVDATSNPLTGTKYNGQELFSGTIILPVGAGPPTAPAAGVTFKISAIIDRLNTTHWTYKGVDETTGTIQVAGDLYFLGKEKDETVLPAIQKFAYGVYGFVSGNTNFNGAFRGVFYVE